MHVQQLQFALLRFIWRFVCQNEKNHFIAACFYFFANWGKVNTGETIPVEYLRF